MIVDSGANRYMVGLHAIGYGEYKVKTFIRKATELGADPNGVTRSP